MFQDVAVEDEVADLAEGDFHDHRDGTADAAGEGVGGAIAEVGVGGAGQGDVVVQHQTVLQLGRDGGAGDRAAGQQAEAGLVDVEVMVLVGDVEQFPDFLHRGAA